MVALKQLYTLLLITTSIILFLIWILALQQYCVSNFYNKPRLKRILSALLYTTLCLILNILIYLSKLYPNPKSYAQSGGVSLELIECVLEAMFIMIGFHIFRMFHMWTITQLYTPINMPIPKWFNYFFNSLMASVIIMIFICYPLMILFNDGKYLIFFYIFIAFVILSQAIFAIYTLRLNL